MTEEKSLELRKRAKEVRTRTGASMRDSVFICRHTDTVEEAIQALNTRGLGGNGSIQDWVTNKRLTELEIQMKDLTSE